MKQTTNACLSAPEIENFINVDIPNMLKRNDIAVYRQIGDRQVSAGPEPQRTSHILVVYHEPHDLTKHYAHRSFSRKTKRLQQKVTSTALEYCDRAYAMAIENAMAKYPIGQGPLCILPADSSVFFRMDTDDAPGADLDEFAEHVKSANFASMKVGTFRVGYYKHITFAVAPMPSAPSTFVVQTSNSRDQSVLTTDFADSPQKLRETVARVCRDLPRLAHPEAADHAAQRQPDLG